MNPTPKSGEGELPAIGPPATSPAVKGPERKHNRYADISVILSFIALLIYFVYVGLHALLLRLDISRYLHPEQPVVEKAWLSWPLATSLHAVSSALAAAAFILSIVSLKEPPRRLYPIAFAIFVFYISYFVLV